MTSTVIDVDGTPVHIDGQGDQAILMLHGWPDTLKLWDATVEQLKSRWCCIRFTLPGYDIAGPKRAASADEIVTLIRRVIEVANRGRPLVLMVHDWGAYYGYRFVQAHPQLVSRLIGLDIGDAGSREHSAGLNWKARLGIAFYQLRLVLAYRIGGRFGDRLARSTARFVRAPADPATVHAAMGYPYDAAWTGAHGGLPRDKPIDPHCPMLFLYGARKPFMFHSQRWADGIAARPGCHVQGLRTGHWLMLNDPEAFHRALLGWLEPKAIAAAA